MPAPATNAKTANPAAAAANAAAAPRRVYRTIPAPAPGSRLRFVGNGSRGGLTREQAAQFLDDQGRPLPGTTPVEVGTGGAWGSSGAGISGYGTVQSATLRRAADKDFYANDDGEVEAYVYFNYRDEGQATLLIPSSITALDPGDTITVASLSLYVDSAEYAWQNRGWTAYNVTFSKHDTLATS